MSSGGHRSPTAFILWPFSPSKKSPLDPPHHGAGWALTFEKRCLFRLKNRSILTGKKGAVGHMAAIRIKILFPVRTVPDTRNKVFPPGLAGPFYGRPQD